MISICHISSEDFLEDVKIQIKKQFKNQDNFAEIIYLSRKQLNRILNNADDLTVHWIKEFCEKLGLDLRNYIFEQDDRDLGPFSLSVFLGQNKECVFLCSIVVVSKGKGEKNLWTEKHKKSSSKIPLIWM